MSEGSELGSTVKAAIKHPVLLAAVALGVGAVGSYLLLRQATATEANPSGRAATSANEQLRTRTKQLEIEVQGLRQQLLLARAAGAAPAPDAVPAPSAQAAPPPPKPTPDQELEWLAARSKFLDRALETEARDDAWAEPIERKLKQLYAEAAGGVRLAGAECRSTICRVAFSYDGEDKRREHLGRFGRDFPELTTTSYAYPGEPANHSNAILYLGRDGHELPAYDYATFAHETGVSDTVME